MHLSRVDTPKYSNKHLCCIHTLYVVVEIVVELRSVLQCQHASSHIQRRVIPRLVLYVHCTCISKIARQWYASIIRTEVCSGRENVAGLDNYRRKLWGNMTTRSHRFTTKSCPLFHLTPKFLTFRNIYYHSHFVEQSCDLRLTCTYWLCLISTFEATKEARQTCLSNG